MARARFVEHTVTFPVRELGPVLDMMRYEQDTVVTWDHHIQTVGERERGVDRYTVRLRCEVDAYQPDRWSSFLLHSTVVASF